MDNSCDAPGKAWSRFLLISAETGLANQGREGDHEGGFIDRFNLPRGDETKRGDSDASDGFGSVVDSWVVLSLGLLRSGR